MTDTRPSDPTLFDEGAGLTYFPALSLGPVA
jgi:hypothetical protein